MRRGEIWTVDFEPSRGSEADKLRPAVVVSNNGANTAVTQLRRGLVARVPAVELQGAVEPDAKASSGVDQAYVVAGHKGQPTAVAKRGGSDAAAGWRARRAAARWRRTSRPSSA